MLNWIKNLFVGTPAPTSTIDTKVEATNAVPYKAETPVIVPVADASVVVVVPEAVVPAAVVEQVIARTPKPSAKPRTAAVKKAVPKTALKKPATRGRKPKAGV